MNELVEGLMIHIRFKESDNDFETAYVKRSGNKLYAEVERKGQKIRIYQTALESAYEVFRV